MIAQTRGVTVKVPATTANMGPGFDCMGMALDIFNTISVRLSKELHISITGQGKDTLSKGPDNMVYRGFAAVFQARRKEIPTVTLRCTNRIPLRRGLGSSAAAVVGGMVAANVMCGKRLPLVEILRLAEAIEGHPDNVAPALLGGCQIVIRNEGRLISSPVPLAPGLKCVLLIPDFEIPTDKARAALPKSIPMKDAIYNIGRAALLGTSLAMGTVDALRLATQDALHQPPRTSLFPSMGCIFQAALDAGAHGVFLSGSGSTILALAGKGEERVAEAMLSEARNLGISAITKVARPWPKGAAVVEEIAGED